MVDGKRVFSNGFYIIVDSPSIWLLGSGNGWKRYEECGESLKNMVESGGGESPKNMVESGGSDGGIKGCLDPWFLPGIMSDSNFTKDSSKVTEIELTAHMIVVNNQRDLVSPPHLSAKLKKGKSQTMTPTLPKSQGLEASGALSKKRQKPKSKKPPTETKVTPPKPTEGSEQSHSVYSGTIPDPQDLERNIQLASTILPSTLDEGTRKSQPLPESTAKTTSRPKGSLGDKDSGENIPPADMETIHPTFADLSGTGAKYQVDEIQSARLRSFLLSDDEAQESEEDILGVEASDTNSFCDDILWKYNNTLPLTERQLVKYLRKVSNALFSRITNDNWEKHEEAAINYVDLKASINEYYEENIAHGDQTDKLVEAFVSSLDKSSNTISDLYKGFNFITKILKEIKNVIKDDPVINKKISKSIQSFTKIFTNIIEAHAIKQDKELAVWAKSSTNMAWNLGSKLLGLERAQNYIQSSMSSLKEDTHSIKTMKTEMYEVFKGQSSGSVTLTLALTHIPENVEGKNDTNTAIEVSPSHTKGRLMQIGKISLRNLKTQLMPTLSSLVHLNLKPQSLKYKQSPSSILNQSSHKEKAKVYYLTAERLQAHIDKEEKIKKDKEEAKLFAISKP
uniref:Toll/interleukin-1 receptor (TIR) domain-containing protein n=1 Tax=Tanacetum cinerariifolium TaxID=118510 RepID=A0A6L2KF93_TANCI|nr:Toll/interleukin-1 receptor (TIR) domain-containing protein [Tanacetum cinerariifolium]